MMKVDMIELDLETEKGVPYTLNQVFQSCVFQGGA